MPRAVSLAAALSAFASCSCAAVLVSRLREENPNEITVGAFLSLSGADSTFGTDTREGIELAVEEINAAGGVKGKKVRVIYEDDKSTTQEASQKVRQLIDRDKVVALLGEVASSRSLAGGLIANTSQVPMVTPSSTAVEVTKGREWVFRTCFTDDQQGEVAARFVQEQLKKNEGRHLLRRAGHVLVGPRAELQRRVQEARRRDRRRQGLPEGRDELHDVPHELKAANPEIIFVPNYYNEMVPIARQAKEVGIPGSMFVGGDGWDSANLIEGAGAELEGAYFTNHYAPDVPWPNSKKFLDGVHRRSTSTSRRASARRATTPRGCSSTRSAARPRSTPEAIRKALAETKDFQGATGTITIDKDRNANKPIVVVQIKDKKFTYATQLIGAVALGVTRT